MTMPLAVTILLYWGPPYPSSFLLWQAQLPVLQLQCYFNRSRVFLPPWPYFIADLFQFNLLSVLFSFGSIAFSIILLPVPQPPAHSLPQ
jgi:hypothetical protein